MWLRKPTHFYKSKLCKGVTFLVACPSLFNRRVNFSVQEMCQPWPIQRSHWHIFNPFKNTKHIDYSLIPDLITRFKVRSTIADLPLLYQCAAATQSRSSTWLVRHPIMAWLALQWLRCTRCYRNIRLYTNRVLFIKTTWLNPWQVK